MTFDEWWKSRGWSDEYSAEMALAAEACGAAVVQQRERWWTACERGHIRQDECCGGVIIAAAIRAREAGA